MWLRILLAHHYHRVDADQIWGMAVVEAPKLATALLRSEQPSVPVGPLAVDQRKVAVGGDVDRL